MDNQYTSQLKELRDFTSIASLVSSTIILGSIYTFSSSKYILDITLIIYFTYLTYLALVITLNHIVKPEYNHTDSRKNYLYPSALYWQVEPIAFGFLYIFLILLFSITFHHLSLSEIEHFNNSAIHSNSWVDSFYFSIVTITTLGYGDITPTTDTAKILTSLESLIGVMTLGLFLYSLSVKRDKNSELTNIIISMEDNLFTLNMLFKPVNITLNSLINFTESNSSKSKINSHETIEDLAMSIKFSGSKPLKDGTTLGTIQDKMIELRAGLEISISITAYLQGLSLRLDQETIAAWGSYLQNQKRLEEKISEFIIKIDNEESNLDTFPTNSSMQIEAIYISSNIQSVLIDISELYLQNDNLELKLETLRDG